MHVLKSVTFIFGLLLFHAQVGAGPLSLEEVPGPLKPWIRWVLRGHEEKQCPFFYNNESQRRCAWPSRLNLVLKGTGGSFSQQWQVPQEAWVPLPGERTRWPQNIKVDDGAAVVSARNGMPVVFLPTGAHSVSGEFLWNRLPESLQLPSGTGLVSVILHNQRVAFPDIDAKGKLWLNQRVGDQSSTTGMRNTLEVQVFRRIVDEIPLQNITRVEMDVAGEHREVTLGRALLPEFIPMVLHSPLPARLEPDGRLTVQVRPGHWTVLLTARHPSPVDTLKLDSSESPWPQEEIWVFDSRNHLRVVQIEGVEPIDPRQTSLPEEWKILPAYRLRPGDSFQMALKRRGDPQPEPDNLSLMRELWLDFDGGGYTLQDQLKGTMTRSWRLEVDPALRLGQVLVDGQPQFITRLGNSQREGVELRRGNLNLVADSRYEGKVSRFPAVGWGHDFRNIAATLHLPPGWTLLTTAGIDNVRHTWVNLWSVFDLFVLLIIAAAVAKLWGWPWGGIALLTLTLIYHEPGAPRQVWLHILAAVALLRVLPPGRFETLIRFYRNVSLIALVIIAFPFAVNQVRVALFPQMERPWQVSGAAQRASVASSLMDKAEDEAKVYRRKAPFEAPPSTLGLRSEQSGRYRPLAESTVQDQYDPRAVIQTGPGLPRWTWKTVRLTWNGPVEQGQTIRLVLLSPMVHLPLRLLSVILLGVLAWRVMGLRFDRNGLRLANPGACLVIVFLVGAGIPSIARADIPSDKLLDELRQRLLAKPDCLPRCAEIPRMLLDIDGGVLRSRLEVHSHADLAVPLPGRRGQWQAQRVLIGGNEARAVLRDHSGLLWLRLPKGIHQVLLEGPLPALDTVQMDLPLRPHRVEAKAKGWTVEGLHENGVAEGQLQLTRMRGDSPKRNLAPLEAGMLPPFVSVERILRLGLEWQIDTRVVRVSPQGSAVVLELPLLEGESVTTGVVRVEHGKVLLNMGPRQTETSWQSVLEKNEKIQLAAPETSGWTEVWRLDASPIWHVESAGIPVVHHQNQGRWLPEWRPWPGETVTLVVSRPEGVEGKTLTIDASSLTLKPGRRATDAELQVHLRSSQGGQHILTLPEDAVLQWVKINGRSQPIRQDGPTVNIPLTPGTQNIHLSWRQRSGMELGFATPMIALGTESVNTSVHIQVPRNLWVLFTGGPRLGPAVLFWGLLIVIGLVSFGLGRSGRTPLGTFHWILLGMGLTQIPVWLAVVVVGWLFALSARRELPDRIENWAFNLTQIGLALLTLAALLVLYYAVKQSLLGWPNMYVAGNGSSSFFLQWFQDRAGSEWPRAWVFSLPTAVYRFLMLLWALWLAFALLRWLRWGWECFSFGGVWRAVNVSWRRGRTEPESTAGQEESPV